MTPEERDRLAKVEQKLEGVEDWLRSISDDVKGLRQDAHMGKGALMLLLKIGAFASAAVAALIWIYEKLPHK